MQGISSDDLVVQLKRLFPETELYFEKAAARHGLSPPQLTHREQVNTHPMTFLSDVLAYPLFQPLMESPEIYETEVGRIQQPAEFFLESREVLDRAFRFAWPKARAEILAMLRGWNVPVDPSWEDLAREASP